MISNSVDTPSGDDRTRAPVARRGQLWPVQLLRAAAAGMIVIGHSQSAIGGIAQADGRSFSRWQPVPWGASVDLFFVISGLIMVYASRDLFGRPGAWRAFLARRVTRIVPIYWLYTTLMLALLAAAALKGGTALPPFGYIAGSYLFFPSANPDGRVFPLFDLGWTLNYEVAFYALFAVLLGFGRWKAALLVVGLILIAAVFGQFVSPAWPAAAFWTRPIIVDFALGVIVGLLLSEGIVLPPAVRAIALVIGVAVFFGDPLAVFVVPLGATVDNGWMRVAMGGLPAALLVAAAVLGPQPNAPAILKPAIRLGDASFSLYLVHPFALIAIEKIVQKLPQVRAIPLPLLVVAAVIGSVILAFASFERIERPLTRWADRWLNRGGAAWKSRLRADRLSGHNAAP